MCEAWGKSRRFGIVPIGHDQIYWYLTLNSSTISQLPEQPKQFLMTAFDGWLAPVPELLSRTAPDAMLRNDLCDREPMDCWHRGQAVLLGDAAHPTTPNMGQGAAMAIESAAVLAYCMENCQDISSAVQRYNIF